jgi:peptidoglycan/LPS O-acetylase OafA/YrhL
MDQAVETDSEPLGADRVQDDDRAHVDQVRLFSYRPALDGLRAIAVIAVLLYHGAQLTSYPLNVTPGGFLGVDLFFVLSGFLITTLLLKEFQGTGDIRFGSFWRRRARRLFPALLLVIAVVAAAFLLQSSLHFDASQLSRFRRDGLSALFYVANWNAAFSGLSYFDQFGGLSPLRHVWSLAIEEQFYLIWPIVVYLGLRIAKFRVKVMGAFALVGAISSALLMALLFHPNQDPSRVYYGTDTRAQAMLIGAFAAFILINMPGHRLGHPVVQALGSVGLAGCVAMFVLVTDNARASGWMYTGGFLLMAVTAALATAAASGPQATPFARALSLRPLVWIGTISYGLYLWHWPLFVLLNTDRTGLGGIALLALRGAATLAVATISYYVVERPIRFGSLRRREWRILAFGSALLCLVVIGSGLAFVKPSSADVALRRAGTAQDALFPTVYPGDVKMLIVGDSTAFSLSFYCPSAVVSYNLRDRRCSPDLSRRPAPERFAVLSDAPLGCSISSGDIPADAQARSRGAARLCVTEFARWNSDLVRFNPDVTMMLFGAWEIYNIVVDGKTLAVGTPAFNQEKLKQLDHAFRILTANGAPLIVLTSPCLKLVHPISPADSPEIAETWRIDNYNSVLRQFAASHPKRVILLDLHGLTCPTGSFTGKINGIPYTDDGIHFTQTGGPLVWNWLNQTLSQIKPKAP